MLLFWHAETLNQSQFQIIASNAFEDSQIGDGCQYTGLHVI